MSTEGSSKSAAGAGGRQQGSKQAGKAGGNRRPDRRPRRQANAAPRRDADRVGYGPRHQGRILAMQVLYEVDLTGHPLAETLERVLANEEELALVGQEDEENQEAAAPALSAADRALHDHVRALATGADANRAAADQWIEAAAPAFPIDRVPAVDRNVLRLAVYELMHEPDVPTRVAINEAVELAKRFGGESSGRFVNGVLGTIAERHAAEPRQTELLTRAAGAKPESIPTTDGEATVAETTADAEAPPPATAPDSASASDELDPAEA